MGCQAFGVDDFFTPPPDNFKTAPLFREGCNLDPQAAILEQSR
jgi:hypothetical protein